MIRLLLPAVVAVALVAVVGCSHTPASRFYTLAATTMPAPGPADSGTGAGPSEPPAPGPAMSGTGVSPSEPPAPGPAVCVGPVEVAAYLDRPQIVTRDGNRVIYSEFDRWAGPLDADITRVLRGDLAVMLDTERIVDYPWRQSLPIDFGITARIDRFDVDPSGVVRLKASWVLYGSTVETIHAFRVSEFTGRATPGNADSIATALNQLLAELSREIADAILAVR